MRPRKSLSEIILENVEIDRNTGYDDHEEARWHFVCATEKSSWEMSVCMYIAKLNVDPNYRNLMEVQVLTGDGRRIVDTDVFLKKGPIGDEWVAPQVDYIANYEADLTFPEECCESALSASELAEMSESKLPTGDFPGYLDYLGIVTLTERSFNALNNLIAPYVEFLPLRSHAGHFVLFRVLNIVDALDREHSEIDWWPQLKKEKKIGEPRQIREVKKYVFYEERLQNEVIFRMPELTFKVFVTQRFIEAVESAGLRGLKFAQLSPPVDERAMYLKKRMEKVNRKRSKKHS